MNLTGNRLGQGPHTGPASGVFGQQCRRGMGFIQILHDGHGLRQAQTVNFQHGHQGVAVELGEGVMQLLAFGQMHRVVLVRQAFEGQRDADPKRSR